MRLAIATPNHLLSYDLETRQLSHIENHRPEYYGISWTEDGERLVLSHSGIDNNSLLNLADYAQSERGWISCEDTRAERIL